MSAVLEAPAHSWLTDARHPTPEHQEITEAVLELARAWEAGSLPLAGVRSTCTGWERFVAMNHAGRGTADKALLLRLCDALVAYQDDGRQTKHGRFTKGDLAAHGGMMVRGAIVWPVSGSHERGWRYQEPRGDDR